MNGEIIAGHTRWKAAQKLGLTRVPVRYLDLDPTQAKLLALADNKTTELAGWDDDLLRAVLGDLQAQDVDLLEGTGFSAKELERLTESAPGGDDPTIEPQWVVFVRCKSELEQTSLLERLLADGYDVKAQVA
jgi:site-specific DNA-methyltransferase (adenine-specific)